MFLIDPMDLKGYDRKQKFEVHHRCGLGENKRMTNLQYVTRKENATYKNGLALNAYDTRNKDGQGAELMIKFKSHAQCRKYFGMYDKQLETYLLDKKDRDGNPSLLEHRRRFDINSASWSIWRMCLGLDWSTH